MNARSERTITLIESPNRTPTEATLFGSLSPTDLQSVEASWSPVRAELVSRQTRLGRHRGTEHGHCDWARDGKVESVVDRRTLVVGIQCYGEWQGVMAVFAHPRASRSWVPFIGRWLRRPVLYVDYLEAAPWNNPDLMDPNQPKYSGVGTQLLMEAIRLSIDLRLEGRVGLHSLPQAVDFYMRRGLRLLIRSDRTYHGLPYFEYTADEARKQLARFV